MSDETQGAVASGDGVARRGPNISPEVEAEILALHVSGMSFRRIGEKLGMPHASVYNVVRRAREEKSETLARLEAEQKYRWTQRALGVIDKLTDAVAKGTERIIDQVEAGERDITPRDIQSLTVAMGIYRDKVALVNGEAAGPGSGGNVAEIAGAVLGAWEAGRKAGMQEAAPKHVVDSTGHVESR